MRTIYAAYDGVADTFESEVSLRGNNVSGRGWLLGMAGYLHDAMPDAAIRDAVASYARVKLNAKRLVANDVAVS